MERFAEFVGMAIGLTVAFVWIFWRMRFLTIPVFVVGFALGLSGCRSIEGAGFTNSGRAKPPACLLSKNGNHEHWGDCPKGRR